MEELSDRTPHRHPGVDASFPTGPDKADGRRKQRVELEPEDHNADETDVFLKQHLVMSVKFTFALLSNSSTSRGHAIRTFIVSAKRLKSSAWAMKYCS